MRHSSILFLTILQSLLCVLYANEDYYKLLGISRTATNEEIRKAFRKLAIRYHPDKNKEDPEKAKQIFSKIANAYDVLNDPEQRKIYDRYGEEGIKKPKENWGGHSYHDIFATFFGGQRGFHKEETFGYDYEEFNRRKAMFSNTDVIELDLETISKFYRREDVWYVYFYKPQDKKHMIIADQLIKLTKLAEGVFHVGSLNCIEQEELCEDFGVYDTPKLLLYTQNSNEEPITYRKEYKSEDMMSLAVSNMHDFLEIVNHNTHEEFMNRYPQQVKVLYFTSEASNPPLLKILSSEYRGYLHFGLIRSSEGGIINKYKVKEFPTLMVINDTEKDGIKYEGEYKKDMVTKFLREFKYSKLKTQTNQIRKLTKALWDSGRCGAGDNKLCFLLIISNENDEAMQIIKNIILRYEHDPIDFYYILSGEQQEFVQAFPKFEVERDKVVIFKPHRRKYGVMEDEVKEGTVSSFIDAVLDGTKASFFVKERHLDIKNNHS